jgi:hypothetical protein
MTTWLAEFQKWCYIPVRGVISCIIPVTRASAACKYYGIDRTSPSIWSRRPCLANNFDSQTSRKWTQFMRFSVKELCFFLKLEIPHSSEIRHRPLRPRFISQSLNITSISEQFNFQYQWHWILQLRQSDSCYSILEPTWHLKIPAHKDGDSAGENPWPRCGRRFWHDIYW